MVIVVDQGTEKERMIMMERNRPRIIREALAVQKDYMEVITPEELDAQLTIVCGWYPGLTLTDLYDRTNMDLTQFVFASTQFAITGIVKKLNEAGDEDEVGDEKNQQAGTASA